ncbi:hypothetical protein CgunFtcFv8_017723 [Champsocephalus gunnari]|uniref:Uncharacterized protein n=1 Tax=Champsocephalus gunnari TaxID=52237 RepID=A0AAN8HRI0_CHAGU|nr:hypothetical protein CgunFtcFv8_017723 [Champsocephalus gunnari]
MVTLITEQLRKQSLEEPYYKAFSFNVNVSLPAVGSSPTVSWSACRSSQEIGSTTQLSSKANSLDDSCGLDSGELLQRPESIQACSTPSSSRRDLHPALPRCHSQPCDMRKPRLKRRHDPDVLPCPRPGLDFSKMTQIGNHKNPSLSGCKLSWQSDWHNGHCSPGETTWSTLKRIQSTWICSSLSQV